jgi:hypothetical protein
MALGPEDRTGLLLDAYALAKAGHPSMPPSALLTLVGAYKDEEDATVWEALESVLLGLDKLLLAASDADGMGGCVSFHSGAKNKAKQSQHRQQ